ncbi:MAG TPA: homoserine kinase [Pyrinomonadaceae bacterium]|nr:homoserine kinase [Pyrinomonadaceae bacterium]
MTTKSGSQSVAIRVPGSTSNIGPGFDCFGLALKLYLHVRATAAPDASEPCRVTTTGAKENETLPRNSANLIYRAMSFAARREGLSLAPVELMVHNDIPLASGLGSSAAAIVAGIKSCSLLTQHEMSDQTILNYATEFEGHPDNVAASVCGGFVINCLREDRTVVTAKFDWPSHIRVVVVSPHSQLPTHVARAALARTVSRTSAVHNLQRTALFTAAIARGRYELLWDAMQDQLHQPQRESLVPGLKDALALPRMPGLLGVALSGAGPSILALVTDHDEEIGARIASCFQAHKIESTTRTLAVANEGAHVP